MTIRQPGPDFVVPDVVVIKRTGEAIALKGDPIMLAITVAIATDFMQRTPGGALDVVSATSEAALTLRVLKAAGLRAVPA